MRGCCVGVRRRGDPVRAAGRLSLTSGQQVRVTVTAQPRRRNMHRVLAGRLHEVDPDGSRWPAGRPGPSWPRSTDRQWPGRSGGQVADSIDGMDWGTVELEPEVRAWLEDLSTERFATAAFYVDLLAQQGSLLGEPYTRQLAGKLRELRFHLDREAVRISYWIASGRRIVLLTVFRKTRMREVREVERARRAWERCVLEQHTADEVGKE
jgi:hypothetical protein